MRTVQDILYEVAGQALVFDAPEGRPSSITSVKVFNWNDGDDSDDEAAISGSGTVEAAPSTTLDADAGHSQANPRSVPLTATTGIAVGRTYLITGAAGLKEWAEVESITSADSVTVKHPLFNDFASGASFVSTRMTATVDTTWCSDETNIDSSSGANPMYRVRWVYVVGGVTFVADTYFNLVRYGARHGVLPQDIDSSVAGWIDRLPTDHQSDQGRRLIDEAYRMVKLDLHGINLDDADIAEAEVVDELVRFRTVERTEWARFISSQSDDQGRHIAAKTEYMERLNALLRLAAKVPIRDKDGAGRKPVAALGLTRR